MHIVAATFPSRTEALSVLNKLEKIGIAPANTNLIEENDVKGLGTKHRSTGAAVRRGSAAGALFGVIVFGLLLKLGS